MPNVKVLEKIEIGGTEGRVVEIAKFITREFLLEELGKAGYKFDSDLTNLPKVFMPNWYKIPCVIPLN